MGIYPELLCLASGLSFFRGAFFSTFVFLVFRYLPDDQTIGSLKAEKKSAFSFSDKVKRVFSNRPFYVLMFGFMGCGVTMAFIDVHMVAHLQDLQLTQTQISIALSLLGATELIAGFLADWMCDRFSKRDVITGFYLLRAVSLIVLLMIPNVIGVLLFAALFGLYWFVLSEQKRRNSRSMLSFCDGRTGEDRLKVRCQTGKLLRAHS